LIALPVIEGLKGHRVARTRTVAWAGFSRPWTRHPGGVRQHVGPDCALRAGARHAWRPAFADIADRDGARFCFELRFREESRVTPAALLLGAVTAERIAELFLARRNTAALLAKGAFEFAPEHYPAIVLMHVLWLASLWSFGAARMISPTWLAVFLSLQVLRAWTLKTLGPRWTTRIIILPGAPLVTNGPYRFLSHPNYLVVVGEITVLPLCLGLPWVALLFSGANAILLSIRIRAETIALTGSRHAKRAWTAHSGCCVRVDVDPRRDSGFVQSPMSQPAEPLV
jgi:methyltransferase